MKDEHGAPYDLNPDEGDCGKESYDKYERCFDFEEREKSRMNKPSKITNIGRQLPR